MVKIEMRKTTTVKPAEKMHRRSVPLSLLDRVFWFPRYNSVVHIYRPDNKGSVVVDGEAVRESLSKTLVHFYPMAGRYRLDCNGTIEIDCNDEGVPFVEAETCSALEDLGDFAPSPDMSILVPSLDLTHGISSYPIMAVQMTYFKCGSVSLGICVEHSALDGQSTFHFIRSWSETARGLDISVPPFLDRTSLLRPRDPPQPKFDHPEYSRYGLPDNTERDVKVSVLRLTGDQLARMKAEANDKGNAATNYTTFEVLTGHIWKRVCEARGLGGEEETRLMSLVSARGNRWKPQLPLGFFGNACFRALPAARAGDLASQPLRYAASKIRDALVRMDSEYLRSAIDHLALMPDPTVAAFGPHVYYSPNFQITTWAKMGLGDADFGWGLPIFTGPGNIQYEKAYIFPCGGNNGDLSVAIALQPQHMEIFEKLFYEFEGKKRERDILSAKL